jgi:hypothetical protein
MHLTINKETLTVAEMTTMLQQAVEEHALPIDFNIPVIIMYDDPRLSMRMQGFKNLGGVARLIQHVFDHARIFRGCLVIFDEETAYTYICFTTLTIEEGDGEFIEEQFSASAKAYFHRMREAQGGF